MEEKRGMFFTLDALIALIIIFIVALMAFPLFEFSKVKTNLQEDTIVVLSSLKVGDMNNALVQDWIRDGTINDKSKTLLEQIGIFYVEGDDKAKILSQLILNSIETNENLGIWYDGVLLASKNKTAYETADKVDVAKQTISGIGGLEGGSATGFSARAYLSSASQKAYTYFGGYVGDGNLSVIIKYSGTIINASMELVANDKFDLYVNGTKVANYSKSPDEYTPLNYTIPIGNFSSGENLVEFRGKNLHISGGFIRIDYHTDVLYEQPSRYYFPGVNGLINVYDGFYIPGDLNSLNINLHMNSNYSTFLTIGNKTVFNNVTNGEETKIISNSQLSSILNYTELSRKTIPLRLGLQNISVNISGKVDIFSVTDVSGSMMECANITSVNYCIFILQGFPSGSVCTTLEEDEEVECTSAGGIWDNKLSPTQSANRELAKEIIGSSGESRLGLVAYSSGVSFYSLDLTRNLTLLNNTINQWVAEGSTCICCGINSATNKFLSQSANTTQKAMIVMSDGEANVQCASQGTGNAKKDAIKAACTAKTKISNLTIYSVGIGNGVDQETLINISNCGNGSYYYSNISVIVDIYREISNIIIDASYIGQTLITSGNLSTRLYPDSYLEFVYAKDPSAKGLIFTSEKKFNSVISGNFSIDNGSKIVETRAISYSGSNWTDKVFINNTKIYDLSSYGRDYVRLGDPYAINIPNEKVKGNNSNNLVNITTGAFPASSGFGSIFNKIIYTIERDLSGYSDIVPKIEGCFWSIEFENGDPITVGDIILDKCYYNPTSHSIGDSLTDPNDAAQLSVYNLLAKLDSDSDGRVDFVFSEKDLDIELSQISGIPFVESSELQVRVWR